MMYVKKQKNLLLEARRSYDIAYLCSQEGSSQLMILALNDSGVTLLKLRKGLPIIFARKFNEILIKKDTIAIGNFKKIDGLQIYEPLVPSKGKFFLWKLILCSDNISWFRIREMDSEDYQLALSTLQTKLDILEK